MEAVSFSGTLLGIQTKNGIVLLAEKKATSKLLENEKFAEKIYKINENIVCGVAGVSADANALTKHARKYALSFEHTYGSSVPVEQLAQNVSDLKQSYTQIGGMRPFGVAFLYAGWDKHEGFQLFQSDPSGNYSRWKASCVGSNQQTIQTALKSQYSDDLSLVEAVKLAIQLFAKSTESSLVTGEKRKSAASHQLFNLFLVELATIELVGESPKVFIKFYNSNQIDILIKNCDLETSKK